MFEAGAWSRYLVTTMKIVPRGTEGAVSVEGTFAGLLASIFLAVAGYLMGQVLLVLSLTLYRHMFTFNLLLFI